LQQSPNFSNKYLFESAQLARRQERICKVGTIRLPRKPQSSYLSHFRIRNVKISPFTDFPVASCQERLCSVLACQEASYEILVPHFHSANRGPLAVRAGGYEPAGALGYSAEPNDLTSRRFPSPQRIGSPSIAPAITIRYRVGCWSYRELVPLLYSVPASITRRRLGGVTAVYLLLNGFAYYSPFVFTATKYIS